MRTLIFLWFCLIQSLLINAQTGRSYGGSAQDYGYETEATPDGGFVVAGMTYSYGAGSSDYWLLKFDSLGNKEWAQPFGTSSFEQIYSLRLAADGGYLIGGYSGYPGPGMQGALMYKVNASGQMEWTKEIHLLTIDHCHSLFENPEGGYYMAGHTESMGNPSGAIWVVKMDSARNVLWDSAYTPLYTSEHAHAAAPTPDSGLIVLGHTDKYSFTNFRLLKLDKHGTAQWSQIYRSGPTNNDTPLEIRITKQGNYALFGYTETQTTASFWLLVVDTAGNELINKHYGTGQNYLWTGRQTEDNGYIMTGYKSGGIYGGSQELILFKTDSAGNLQWTKEYGGTGSDEGYGLTSFHQNKYVVIGGTTSFSTGGAEDVWVLLTDSLGNLTTYTSIANDAGIISIVSPQENYCSQSFDTRIVLQNAGLDTLYTVQIYYRLDTLPIDSIPWTGALSASLTDTLLLQNLSYSNGPHTFKAWTSLPNDSMDINASNDTSFSHFAIDTNRAALPLKQGFEGDTLLSENWTSSGLTTLLSVDTPGGFGLSRYSMRADFFHIMSGTEQLISPPIDLSGSTLPLTLEFSVAYPGTGTSNYHYRDTLRVSISADCGNTWATLYTKADTTLATGAVASAQYSPASNDWRKEQIDLNSFSGQLVQLRFEAKSGNGNELFIDDININNDSIVLPTSVIPGFSEPELLMYPNPANNLLIVDLRQTILATDLEIINALGEEVYHHLAQPALVTIQTSTLASGIYILKAWDGRYSITKKISIIR